MTSLMMLMAIGVTSSCLGEISGNVLTNGSFDKGVGDKGLPTGWWRYAGGGKDQEIKVVDLPDDGGKGVLLVDGDPSAEIGLGQRIEAKPGLTYEASVEVRAIKGASTRGAYLQLRFLPSNELCQTDLTPSTTDSFTRISTKGTAPAGTSQIVFYLYTHRVPTPKVLLRRAKLVAGVAPPPPPPPPPVPPVYTRLKKLYLDTTLIADGKANVTIVVPASGIYREAAAEIQQAIETLTGVKVPIVNDASPEASVPIRGHLIVLGNRSTNKTISALYDLYYTLLDLRYPGPEGYVVRTLHNPFGDGRNVVFVGGSDAIGVSGAAKTFVDILGKAGAKPGALTIGRLMEIKLGKGIVVPTDVRAFEIWEASKGYGSTGYFGWNSLSKRLAMYYMTGDPANAREFIRLSFPDEKAKKDIAEIDGERIENKDEPLSGPYHYNAHMMILFWDLVEESPVFTDAERLRVTNAFAKQLNHRKGEGIYTLTKPPSYVGTRHGQWSAISLYCLGRYFQKDYPNPIWKQCVEGGKWHFRSLHSHAWVAGENDNLFWYNTAIAPILTYLTLTGDRVPVENGVLATLLRGQEILVSGRVPDWALNSASIGFLHKAAYITRDGRWLAYRDRTGVDLNVFRLGQSCWPDDDIKPKPPDDLVGTWSINPLPEPMWWWRQNGFKQEESFLFGSFRTTTDASGDFILIDGFNGASRNPYHTFAILELRLAGNTLLKGYRNQVITRADGLVEPHIAMDAALKHQDVIGQTAIAIAEVPDAAYCNWRRALVQRVGRYAVVIDDLTFRADCDNIQVELLWETENAPKAFVDGHLAFEAWTETPEGRSVPGGQIRCCDVVRLIRRGNVAAMEWVGPVKKGQHRIVFTLVGIEPGAQKPSLACYRVDDNAAIMASPGPGLVTAGTWRRTTAALSVLTTDGLFAEAAIQVGLPPTPAAEAPGLLIAANHPIDVDWDFATGKLNVVASEPTTIRVGPSRRQDVAGGRHVISGAAPDADSLNVLATALASRLDRCRRERAARLADDQRAREPSLPPLSPAFTATVGGPVLDLCVEPTKDGNAIYAAHDKAVHFVQPDGHVRRVLKTDGPIRMIRWWPEHKLLLAGCADEKVIAFDTAGNRKWAFVSEMDPAVFRAAKTYWFKSCPGLEGIHGLYTGVFLDGKSQAFVGSACTLEILDETGKLVKRMPQFWGLPSHFAIVDGPGGSLNLLASRRWNGTNNVAIINNKTLDPSPRGFDGVPAGATHVPGWSSMNRYHLFYEDLDGDGTKEVVSEINGTWNRVTVWTKEGRPLHDASFGPGERIQQNTLVKNMRDLEVADLDGDGKKEILAATSSGLIVCLDHQCKKRWATRLASPPTAMKCVTPTGGKKPWIVIGCEDGSVVVLDHSGKGIRSANVDGQPTCIDAMAINGKPIVLLATAKGQVKGFAVGD